MLLLICFNLNKLIDFVRNLKEDNGWDQKKWGMFALQEYKADKIYYSILKKRDIDIIILK